MKKTTIIITICSLSLLLLGNFPNVSAQNAEKKLSYNFFNEYGFFVGGDNGFTGVFVNNMKFNKTNDILGIGVGYEISSNSGQCIPLFLNYRHYFNTGRKVMPLMNVAAGTLFNFWNKDVSYYGDNGDYLIRYDKGNGFGLYATIAGGFKVAAFSFSSGFFLKSSPCNSNTLNGGIEVKAGYTF